MARFADGIPQLFKTEMGIEACVKDLLEALEKYDEYFKDERKSG
jgi:hypothetical protein